VTSAQFANGYAVLLTNGAHDNEIGDIDGVGQSNVITNSLYAGVYLDASAGAGNIVRPNTIFGNAVTDADLGIDIFPPGQNPNDPLDADSGPNGGQNWPVLQDSKYNNANAMRTISGYLSSTPGRSFKVDFYRAVGCLAGGRAEAASRIGTVNVTTASSGIANGLVGFQLDMSNAAAPAFVTATVTDLVTNSTSEFSPCLTESFLRDGFE